MSQTSPFSRRRFLATTGAALGATLLAGRAVAAAPTVKASPARKFLGFSKPFMHLQPNEIADLVSEIGWDGIDCPVRATLSQVKPERVAEDLPPLVEALRKQGKSIDLVTTDIVRPDARAEKVLRTIARLGIKTYRFGFARYPKDRSPEQKLREFAAEIRDLSALNRELGLQGGYQNHSGADYLGATLWELREAFHDLDPATVGVCFDIGQAMVEGGLSWPTQTRLMQSRWCALQVKDFIWDAKTPKGWDAVWVPLGQGRVTQSVLTQIGARTFAGPIIQHHEHLKPGTPRAELAPALKQEFATLRNWIT